MPHLTDSWEEGDKLVYKRSRLVGSPSIKEGSIATLLEVISGTHLGNDGRKIIVRWDHSRRDSIVNSADFIQLSTEES